MTHSSDREHRTPLSPVRRHDSISEPSHSLTPEPANLTALLSRRVETPICFIETVIIVVKSPSFLSETPKEQQRWCIYDPGVTVFRVEMRYTAERFLPLKKKISA